MTACLEVPSNSCVLSSLCLLDSLVYDVDLDLDRLTASGTYASGTIELRKREAGHVPAVLPDNSSSSSARTALNRAPSKSAAALSPRRSQAEYASVSAGSIASPRGNANLSRQPSASSSRTYEELPPRLSNLSVSSGRPSSVRIYRSCSCVLAIAVA
mgnify:CR=1 FL=1